jgi:hypothetical protein
MFKENRSTNFNMVQFVPMVQIVQNVLNGLNGLNFLNSLAGTPLSTQCDCSQDHESTGEMSELFASNHFLPMRLSILS